LVVKRKGKKGGKEKEPKKAKIRKREKKTSQPQSYDKLT